MLKTASVNFSLPFVKKEKASADAYSFYFDRIAYDFDFLPGQYVRLTLPHENPDERGISRFFTISSSPLEKNYFTITTRIIKSSFKKKLVTVKEGEVINFFGPLGNFILDEEKKESRIFLAGGVGITPFHSMIAYAGARKLSIPLALFVSFSTIRDFLFCDELLEISKNNPNIKIIYVITHPQESLEEWDGETGRISNILIKKYSKNISESLCYVAGPPKMVEAMGEIVRNMGVSEEKIFKENFVGY